MPLIHPRLLKTKLPLLEIHPTHLAILQAWRDSILDHSLLQQKETALHAHFIQKILIEILGYQGFGGERWTLAQEQQIGAGSVDIALGEFSAQTAQVVAPFELKGAKTKDLDAMMPGRHKSPVQQAWEYAMDAGAKWVLLSNYLEIRLYAVGYGRQVYEVWDLARLTDPLAYSRLQWLLHADQLLSGATAEILAQSQQIDKEITNQLYADYKSLREQLLQALTEDNPTVPALDLITYTQTILDRILFIAFAEDRGLLPIKSIVQAYAFNNPYCLEPKWRTFKCLFKSINDGNEQLKIPAYDGGLFAPNPALEQLIVRDEVCAGFKRLAEYDFASEVGVTVLGHIFEQSIADIEALQAAARGEMAAGVSKRKQHGVVYTPDHITHFIVAQTLGGHLQARFNELWAATAEQRHKSSEGWKKGGYEVQFWRDYQQILRATRVLDPSCGSGAFLVAAFDFLYEEYTRVNDRLADLTGSYDVFDLDKEILNRNLFGVDVNAESIEITKLSLWLKTAQRGKLLNDLDKNIKVGNSLVAAAAYTDKPFVWQQAFPQVFAATQWADIFGTVTTWFETDEGSGFDVVLGNPPYVRQELIGGLKPYLEQNYAVYHGVVDLYAYFFELGLRLLKAGGRLGFIASSTFFKTGSGARLRQLLQTTVCLECVVDFGDLQVFEGVTTYPAILTMRKVIPTADHQLRMMQLNMLPEDMLEYFAKNAGLMNQANLDHSAWHLESDQLYQLRQKIIANKWTLKAVYGSPLYGIKTSLNEAFVIDATTRAALLDSDPNSAALIKPFLEGKFFKKWRVEHEPLFVILISKGWTKEKINTNDEVEAWQWFAHHYPAIASHLQPFATKAKKRKDQGDFWWELRACSYYAAFEQEKIIYPDISQGPKFSLDKAHAYFNNTAYFINSNDLFLLGLLNSNLIWAYLGGIAEALRGGVWRLRLFNINIETIPIPNVTAQQKHAIAELAAACQQTAIACYQQQHAVRRRIPDLCPADRDPKLSTKLKHWWTLDYPAFRAELQKTYKQDIPLKERNDWEQWFNEQRAEINQLSTELAQLEQQLNQQIYQAFELTAAEIKLIEQVTA